jgi:CheY-like chemotaxis protein
MSTLRVLQIDDEPDILDIGAASLGLDPEIEVRGCGSGADGLAAAAQWRPDLILLDIMMPVWTGRRRLHVCGRIHRPPAFPSFS